MTSYKNLVYETHSENIITSCCHHLLRRHHSSPGVNAELLILVTIDDAVGDVAIGSKIPVVSKDTVYWFATFVAVSFCQADAIGDLWEGGRVVILVLDVNDDPHSRLACGHWTIYNCNLRINEILKNHTDPLLCLIGLSIRVITS